ncbi:aldehyde dehydrogenase family protein [Niveispirillum sp.]|uniref:aldehyde dehydrogenase family protein n=1 Tax=Niveispirillum sp. TaxID=1917217 RepID=UPI001B714660|nr:aldehyde dehydrogenase family protein [Niveispirillum sp.]MBP7338657.1 aldehyde dehydrogenase family protein [Niveispirillum sp.]
MSMDIADATRASLARPFRMLIGAEWREASEGARMDVINPADEQSFASIPLGTATDIDRAVAAARHAFDNGAWTGLMPGRRAQILWRVADLLEERAQEFAELETLDNGKPVSAARAVDLTLAIGAFRYWSGWCTKITGETPTVDLPGPFMAMTLREPVGVVGIITPWNFPLVQAVVKIAPALAAGCTMVVKPAEQTSLTLLRLGEVLLDAGVPPGVVNIVSGLGSLTGAALAAHPDVDKISFTGSTPVGKTLLAAAQGNLKRLTLELGGKSPTILMEDADLDRAIPSIAGGIFRNAGQMCAAGSRLLVARAVADRVLEGLVQQAGALRIGPGIDPTTTLGPLVSAAQQHRVLSYVDGARRDGVAVVTGGHAAGDRGYFVEPTILLDPSATATVSREEIFGPVLVVTPFDDPADLARLANDTVYGLSANIWSRDVTAAYRLARQVKAGTITVNSGMIVGPALPFGGFKQSGWGREGGAEGLSAFMETKTIITAL